MTNVTQKTKKCNTNETERVGLSIQQEMINFYQKENKELKEEIGSLESRMIVWVIIAISLLLASMVLFDLIMRIL